MKKIISALIVFSLLLSMTVPAMANGNYVWPLIGYTTITSNFGYRNDPFTGEWKGHGGTDIGAPYGTPVYASSSGTLTIGYNGCTHNYNSQCGCGYTYGNFVYIDDDYGMRVYYAHLTSITASSGRVEQGQQIGTVGSTGNSTGSHLHFEMRTGTASSTRVNPLNYVSSSNQIGLPSTPPDTEAPTISGLNVKDISGDSFTVECNLNDNVGVTRVWFVIYAPGGTYEFGDSASNGYFSKTLYTKDYGGAGTYSVHFYVYDAKENRAEGRTGKIYAISPGKPIFGCSIGEYGTTTFSWKATTLTDNYDLRIYYSDGTLYNTYWSIKNTSYSVSLPYGNYYAVLSSVNTTYNTWTNSDHLVFSIDNYKPKAPTVSVTDCNVGNETVIIWNSIVNAQSYYLYIREKNTGVYYYSANVGNKTQFSIILPAGEYYTYVSSCNAMGTSSTYSSWKVKALPGKPIVGSELGEYGEVEFYWQAVSLADQYDLRIYNTDDTVYMTKYGIKENKYMINLPQGEYYATVSAVNLSNENWTNSDRLNFVIDNYKPKGPCVNVENCYVGESTVITWDSVVNATTYYVFIREKNTKVDYYNAYIGNKTEFSITLPEGEYYTYISAYNSEGYNATYADFNVLKTETPIPSIKSITTKNGDNYCVQVTSINLSFSYEIIVAGYNGNKLIDLAPLVDGVATLYGDIHTIKVMAWGSLSSLTSLCEAEVIPESEFIIE